MHVPQLHEVLAGIRVLDPAVGEVLGAQGDLVLACRPERVPDADVVPEVEGGAEVLVGIAVHARRDGRADAALHEPGRASLVEAVARMGAPSLSVEPRKFRDARLEAPLPKEAPVLPLASKRTPESARFRSRNSPLFVEAVICDSCRRL